MQALSDARHRRAEMVPLFLATIEKYLAPTASAPEDPTFFLYILYLLAEWREKSAYRPLAHLLRSSAFFLFFDETFEPILHRAIAAVFDGDPEPLYEVALDPGVNQFTSAAVLEAIAMLVWSREIQTDSISGFLAQAFGTFDPEDEYYLLDACARLVGMLGLFNLKLLVRKAIAQDHLSEYSLEEFEEDLAYAKAHPGQPRNDYNNYAPVTDAISEISAWPCYAAIS
ncbi:DUF1186 domain-containing protein (plasmid) [Methylocapsa polymorpha]|uniref:DUF1186 domain-containing protein n=1 Tax=Methylocapsa polymorpha TaxID=3080828 RepID=A0ABZ0HZG2_9HYPH|nr:DUF1186 domain-containing protein [Methylocapsa sp. RX1]WOJ91804.1 DUF1186 domain-containing protein [Methylocapsa sp. RX1]